MRNKIKYIKLHNLGANEFEGVIGICDYDLGCGFMINNDLVGYVKGNQDERTI